MILKKLFLPYCVAATVFTAAAHAENQCDHGVDLVIDFQVKTDAVPAFEAILGGIAEANATVPGFRSVEVRRDIADRAHFVLVEGWESVAHHQAHHNRLVDIGAWQGVLDMMEVAPEFLYTTVLDGGCPAHSQ
ncbi:MULTISPECIES: antibiotic biosynthesis monooxygenase family protein [Kordiimonas]|jgi:quinol monooxygenase YgiN|uniref:antibiotic biosynthesis monooxygenase family protein n=1 Tax=Kordiimonas TaxID=288021 RepID=UPI00257B1F4B|nr:antibiotic biosynthesis monooxygenase family protein [Kordiimonas sp. UBA4487]